VRGCPRRCRPTNPGTAAKVHREERKPSSDILAPHARRSGARSSGGARARQWNTSSKAGGPAWLGPRADTKETSAGAGWAVVPGPAPGAREVQGRGRGAVGDEKAKKNRACGPSTSPGPRSALAGHTQLRSYGRAQSNKQAPSLSPSGRQAVAPRPGDAPQQHSHWRAEGLGTMARAIPSDQGK